MSARLGGRSLLAALVCCAAVLAAAVPARADVVDDAPAVAARGLGDMRLFIRGTDGALWTRTWSGTAWASWSSLGGVLTSGPAVGVRPNADYDIVVRGPGNAYYHRAFTPAHGWSDFVSLGGAFISAPTVSYRKGTGYIDVAGIATDHQLWFKTYVPGSGWSAWSALGGSLSGTPSMVSPRNGAIDIWVRGTNNQLYQKSWTGDAWTGFIALGGALTSGIAATAWDTNRRDIFARSTDGAMWIRSWTNTGSYGPWARLGGHPTSGPAATSVAPNRLLVFARDGQRVVANSFSSTWTGWQSFGYAPLFTAPPPPPPSVPGPTPGSTLRLNAGFGCIPQGGRLPVRVRIKQRTNRLKPRVIKVVFFIDGGKRKRVDRHAPYRARLRVTFKRGSKHRVHARIFFRRKGHHHVLHKTVSKRFTMCK